MKPTALQVHKSWVIRAVLVLAATVLAEVAVVSFLSRPLVWVALIAGSLPLTLYVFVAMPLLKRRGLTQ
jgi:hypothetical protein